MPRMPKLKTKNPQSLAQTGHIVSALQLVLVCKKVSNAIHKSAPGQAAIQNVRTRNV